MPLLSVYALSLLPSTSIVLLFFLHQKRWKKIEINRSVYYRTVSFRPKFSLTHNRAARSLAALKSTFAILLAQWAGVIQRDEIIYLSFLCVEKELLPIYKVYTWSCDFDRFVCQSQTRLVDIIQFHRWLQTRNLSLFKDLIFGFIPVAIAGK